MSDSPRLLHDLARDVRLIAGADEVGRASLAGPIMAAGVLFDIKRLAAAQASRAFLNKLNDSKRLSHSTRERLAQGILVHAEVVALVSVRPKHGRMSHASNGSQSLIGERRSRNRVQKIRLDPG